MYVSVVFLLLLTGNLVSSVVTTPQTFFKQQQASQVMAILDVDNDGEASPQDVRDAIISMYKERKHLAFTLRDAKAAVVQLERTLAVVLHLAAVFGYLAIFRIPIYNVWITVSSVILAFAFVFGNSLRRLYESVIFIFLVHPFDVGDAVTVDGTWYARDGGSEIVVCMALTCANQGIIVLWNTLCCNRPLSMLRNGTPAANMASLADTLLSSLS